jgi:hypothetical protein
MDMISGSDIGRRLPDHHAVFDDRPLGGDGREGDLMAEGDVPTGCQGDTGRMIVEESAGNNLSDLDIGHGDAHGIARLMNQEMMRHGGYSSNDLLRAKIPDVHDMPAAGLPSSG